MSNRKKETIRLKAGRERSVLNRHPWIFSGAIEHFPDLPNGSSAVVEDSQGNPLGVGYFNRECSLAVRLLGFSERDAKTALRNRIGSALRVRDRLRDPQTTALRLINGEADGVPGCIVDQYADVLVVQIGTLGMELLKETLLEILRESCTPRAIIEKSNLPSRGEEKLPPVEGMLFGEAPAPVSFIENGIHFKADLQTGQKTGFFLDHREMRALVRAHAKDRQVLNCFSYSGAFSAYAYAGGASFVTSIDSSESAIAAARENLLLNGFPATDETLVCGDVFDLLRKITHPYNFIILDPPAFAKRRNNVEQALKGYNEINRVALQKLPPGGLLLTCSCSYHVDEELFQKTIFQASRDAGRAVRILQRHRLAWDHPISIFHPEGEYLKSLLMIVE